MIALLLDHLWQSTALLVLVGGLTLLFRNNGAHVRHALWTAASLKFLVPFAALAALGEYLSGLLASPLPAPLMIETLEVAAQPFSGSDALQRGLDWLPWLATAWAAGFLALGLFWFTRWLTLRAALRGARDTDIGAPMSVKLSPALLEPGLVGIFRPTLLLPEGIAEKLSPAELAAIVTHETCHMRRRDNFTAALHMLVEALFWFWPPVWWLGTRLIVERERACDEAVLASGSDPQAYAESILKVCKFYVQSPLACAAGVSGADLKTRIEEIMRNTAIARLSLPKKALLLAAGAAVLALPLSLGLPNVPAALAHSIPALSVSPPVRIVMDTAPVPTPSMRPRIAKDSARVPALPAAPPAPPVMPVLPAPPPPMQVAQLLPPTGPAQGAACRSAPIQETHTRPPYPAAAYRNGETGTVDMQVSVANDGKPGDIRVTRSSSVALLDEAAIEHVKDRWRWEAPVCGGFQTMVRIAFAIPPVTTILPWTQSSALQPGDAACVRSPVSVIHTQPPYPPISRRMGETGTVELLVTIVPEGFASDVVVARSSGAVRLDDAARVDVGSVWRWQPREGCNPAQTMVRVVFSLLDAH